MVEPIDDERLKQRREPGALFSPRNPNLVNPVLLAFNARHLGLEDRFELTSVEMAPTPGAMVITRRPFLASRAHQSDVLIPSHLDDHLLGRLIEFYVCDRPGAFDTKNLPVKIFVAHAGRLEYKGAFAKPCSSTQRHTDLAGVKFLCTEDG